MTSVSCSWARTASEIAERTACHPARARARRDTVVTFAVDFWSLAFQAPGDYTLRILVSGSERKRDDGGCVEPPGGSRPGSIR